MAPLTPFTHGLPLWSVAHAFVTPRPSPPSTVSTPPVVHSAHARYSKASAISVVVPIRPRTWAGASESQSGLGGRVVEEPGALVDLGEDGAGPDAADADAVGTELGGEYAGERLERPLAWPRTATLRERPAVCAPSRRTAHSPAARPGAVWPARSASSRPPRWCGRCRAALLLVQLVDRPRYMLPGVRQQHVQAAAVLDRRIDHGATIGVDRDVTGHRSAGVADVAGHGVELLGSAAGDRDPRPFGAKCRAAPSPRPDPPPVMRTTCR